MEGRQFFALAFLVLVIAAKGCAERNAEQSQAPPDGEVQNGPKMEPFKFEASLRAGEVTIQFAIFFIDQYAVEFDLDDQSKAAAVYDLDNLWWQDFEPPRKVTLADCEKWALATAERSRTSLSQSTDKNLNRFVEASLEPKFNVSEEDGVITMSNDVLSYRLSNPISISDQRRRRYFAYDRLNAYRKAMVERKLAPFPQLAVDDELEKRNLVPGKIDLTITTPSGDVELAVNVGIAEMSETEASQVTNAIRQVAGN